MEKQKSKKNFFKTKIFKWILILILEFVSIIILGKVLSKPSDNGSPFSKPFLIYIGICTVLSIGSLIKINSAHKKSQREENRGVIRIMTHDEAVYEETGKLSSRLAVLTLASFFLSPFLAPVNLGTIIHKIICSFL